MSASGTHAHPTAAPCSRSASAAAASSRPPWPRRPQRGSTSRVLTSAIAVAVLPAVVRGGAEADGPVALGGDEHVVPTAGPDGRPPGRAGLRAW